MLILAIIIFILILSFLVLVHEFGHFIVAKRNHIHVEEFGIGFPPRIWSKKKGGTIYSINAIPLGGFVKLLGEEQEIDHENSFSRRSPWVRAKVIATGVLFNFILAWVLLTLWLWVVPPHIDNKVIVVQVAKDSPAAEAGLKPNDFITKINGEEIKSADNLSSFTKDHQGQEIEITLKRFDKETTKKATLSKNSAGYLGISMIDTGGDTEKVTWYRAPLQALVDMGQIIWVNVKFIGDFVHSLFSGGSLEVAKESVSGPIGIFAFLYQIIFFGWFYILRFTALVSLALGFFNILPLPALDGGRLVFIAAEGIRGKKLLRAEFENALHWVGFMFLLALMVIITYNDIVKWVINK